VFRLGTAEIRCSRAAAEESTRCSGGTAGVQSCLELFDIDAEGFAISAPHHPLDYRLIGDLTAQQDYSTWRGVSLGATTSMKKEQNRNFSA
jgi:hypothetical protein